MQVLRLVLCLLLIGAALGGKKKDKEGKKKDKEGKKKDKNGKTHDLLDPTEYLKNEDFEDPMPETKPNWHCNSGDCAWELSNDSFKGTHSVSVTERSSPSSGIKQKLSGIPTGVYHDFTAYVKLQNEFDTVGGHTLELSFQYKTPERVQRLTVASMPYTTVSSGWVECGGEIFIPADSSKWVVFITVSDNKDVNYLVDTATLRAISPDPDWEDKANERIREYRMGPIQLSLTVPDLYDHSKVRLELKQTKRHFPFGAAVETKYLYRDYDSSYALYRDYFYDMFNMATIKNDMKWRFMEPEEGSVNFYTCDQGLQKLQEKGIPLRGHCITWGKDDKIPPWMEGMSKEEVKAAVLRRIQYMTEHYNGKIFAWDVDNEDLHGHFYERVTGNPQFLETMFSEMHDGDPTAELHTNDYQLTNEGNYVIAYKNQVMKMKLDDVPISGVGVQAHYNIPDLPDVHLLYHRLNVLSGADLPLWITELNIECEDVETRADVYEDAIRMMYSHPNVMGITQWDFWDITQTKHKHSNFVDGLTLVENEAGKRVRQLWQEEWSTHINIIPDTDSHHFEVDAFYGTFNLTLYYADQEEWTVTIENTPDSDTDKVYVIEVGTPFDSEGVTSVQQKKELFEADDLDLEVEEKDEKRLLKAESLLLTLLKKMKKEM